MGATITVGECVMLVVDDAMLAASNKDNALSAWLKSSAVELNMPLSFSRRGAMGELDVTTCFAELLVSNDEFRRNRLLLCGSDLADAVTANCLLALAAGYDVYLLTDLISISDKKYSMFHWERLFQAGAVPTTLAQMMNEWLLSEADAQVANHIKQLADEFRRLRS